MRDLVTHEAFVPSVVPDISLYVREKHPADMTTFAPERTVLFVHGATYPAETAFDLALDGFSWMNFIARRGFDVFLLDVRGWDARRGRRRWMRQPRPIRRSRPRSDCLVCQAICRSETSKFGRVCPIAPRLT